jgi:hypothetical protein
MSGLFHIALDGERDLNDGFRSCYRNPSNDRLFRLLPNFMTLEDADKVSPLTSAQKSKTVARGAFDWGSLYGTVLSGLSQAVLNS